MRWAPMLGSHFPPKSVAVRMRSSRQPKRAQAATKGGQGKQGGELLLGANAPWTPFSQLPQGGGEGTDATPSSSAVEGRTAGSGGYRAALPSVTRRPRVVSRTGEPRNLVVCGLTRSSHVSGVYREVERMLINRALTARISPSAASSARLSSATLPEAHRRWNWGRARPKQLAGSTKHRDSCRDERDRSQSNSTMAAGGGGRREIGLAPAA